MGGKKPLHLPRRFEPFHDPLSSSHRMVGVLRTVVEAFVLAMLDAGHDLRSVSARAGKYSWLDEGRDFSGNFQHTQNRCGAAKEVKSAVVGGHLLIGSGAGTEEVAQLVVGATEFASRSRALEPVHRAIAAFDAAMTLLQSVTEILAVAMPHTCARVVRIARG
jgi:hypothetical protein